MKTMIFKLGIQLSKQGHPACQTHMSWELFSCQIHPQILGIRIKQTLVTEFRAGQINWVGMKPGALKFFKFPSGSNVYTGLRTMIFMKIYNHFLHNVKKTNN